MASHIHECKCTCLSCGYNFSYDNIDIANNKKGRWEDLASLSSSISGSKIEQSIALNHQNQSYQKDFNKCPRCGSRKIEKKYDDYYVDVNGEYLANYTPTASDKISEVAGKGAGFLGDFVFKGCLILLLIPFILVIYAVFQILKVFF